MDTFRGMGGDDYISAGIGDDFVDGGEGNDTLYASDGIDTLIGGVGNDSLDGGAGDDQFIFERGDGQDAIQSGRGLDKIIFGAGIAPGDVTFSHKDQNLIVRVKGTSDQIALERFFLSDGGFFGACGQILGVLQRNHHGS